jgi:hypothetical protein
VEGVHFVAGPWFTVQKDGDDWERLDTVWLSNGARDDQARVEIRLRLAPAPKTEVAGDNPASPQEEEKDV